MSTQQPMSVMNQSISHLLQMRTVLGQQFADALSHDLEDVVAALWPTVQQLDLLLASWYERYDRYYDLCILSSDVLRAHQPGIPPADQGTYPCPHCLEIAPGDSSAAGTVPIARSPR